MIDKNLSNWVLKFVLLLLLFSLIGCQYGYYQGPSSDHFNGYTFFNPDQSQPITRIQVLKQLYYPWKYPWQSKKIYHYSSVHQIPTKGIKVTFINHATFLIQSKELNFLTDPVWSYRVSPFSWIGPHRVREPGIPFNKLPPIHVILISHNHYDHLDIETLKKLNATFHPLFIVPLGNKVFLNAHHINNVIELDWWQHIKVKHAIITFLPAIHWSTRWIIDINRTLWGSYGIEVDNKKIYFAGDSAYNHLYKNIRIKWGTPDLALLPIGSYAPRSWLQSVHMDPTEAVAADLDLHSRYCIAMHYGTFQLSSESIQQPINDLYEAANNVHLSKNQFMILPEGHDWYL